MTSRHWTRFLWRASTRSNAGSHWGSIRCAGKSNRRASWALRTHLRLDGRHRRQGELRLRPLREARADRSRGLGARRLSSRSSRVLPRRRFGDRIERARHVRARRSDALQVRRLDRNGPSVRLKHAVSPTAEVANRLTEVRRQGLLPRFPVADLLAVGEAVAVGVDAAR